MSNCCIFYKLHSKWSIVQTTPKYIGKIITFNQLHFQMQNLYCYKQQKMFSVQDHEAPKQVLSPIVEGCVHQNQQILYLRGHLTENELVSVCFNKQNNLISIRQCSINKKSEITVTSNEFDLINQEIGYAFIQGEDGFIITSGILNVFYLSVLGQRIIKLDLGKQIQYQNCTFDLKYPILFIFGKHKGHWKSEVTELNLETLVFKVMNDGKGYSPGARRKQISVLIENRIYTFGGQTKQSNPCSQLLYTFDIEKGYWFALEMKYPEQQDFSECKSVAISNSKVLIMSNKEAKRGWVLQIHQSRLTEITNFDPKLFSQKIVAINGHYIWYCKNKWGYCNKGIIFSKQ